MSSETMILLENVSKRYTLYQSRTECFFHTIFPFRSKKLSFTALQPLSLKINRGECVGIMGVNGSGKSTLLQLIAGTLNPSSGRLFIGGRIAPLLELGSWMDARATGRENIYNAGFLHGLTREQISSHLKDIADFAEIGDFLDQPISSYSSGMVLRLAFAASVHLDADILLMDEILAVGDAYFAGKCQEYLRRYMADKTVLLISHDCNVITSLCSRALLLDHGKLILDGSPRLITERYLETCYSRKQKVEIQSAETESEFTEDFRHDNPIHSEEFNFQGRSFGEHCARVIDVFWLNKQGERVTEFHGGELLTLCIRAEALQDFASPSVGFLVRSPAGENLFGDVTSPDMTEIIRSGQILDTRFQFVMPIFPQGKYTVSVSIASGSLENHRIQFWQHQALLFNIRNELAITGILFSLPLKKIDIHITEK